MWWKAWISVLVCGYVTLTIDWDGAGWHEVQLMLLGANLVLLLDEVCTATARSLRKWGLLS